MSDDWAKGSLHPVTIPTGIERTCSTWATEGAWRMLHHNIHPDVAEDPERLVVYGGTGRCARGWEAWKRIRSMLEGLQPDETLLIQSGKPVGVVRTFPDAPRVLIANSNLVPAWATKDAFDAMEAEGLMMFGQMTAGSWIYIGTQGILQGTYETLAAAARTNFGASDLIGRIFLSAGCGGMGGAQPLATTMLGGVALIVEVNRERLEARIRTKYLDDWVEDIDEAIRRVEQAKREHSPLSIGLLGNAADVFPDLLERGFRPDLVSDQTSAHDPLDGYVAPGTEQMSREERHMRRDEIIQQSQRAMARHVEAMVQMQEEGCIVFDYGNNIREQAVLGGLDRDRAFCFPGFVPAYIRPLFCDGKGPFRWVALSGNPADIHRTDLLIEELFPEDESLLRWIRMANEQVAFQGLPSRICWLGHGERARMGLAINDLVASGEITAPIAIGRDHLDCGSVASPNRETEAMLDGSDAVSDWPLLNAMANVASGASWVSIHHGGGVGIGYSQHAGMVVVADGTEEAALRLQRVLTTDPQLGILRHADAGYTQAIRAAEQHGIDVPMKSKPLDEV